MYHHSLRLAYSVIDQRSSTSHFTLTELKDLFTFDEGTDCQTHDLLGCDCKGQGETCDIQCDDANRGLRAAEDIGVSRGVQEGEDEDIMLVDMLPGLVKASQMGIMTAEEVNHPQSLTIMFSVSNSWFMPLQIP